MVLVGQNEIRSGGQPMGAITAVTTNPQGQTLERLYHRPACGKQAPAAWSSGLARFPSVMGTIRINNRNSTPSPLDKIVLKPGKSSIQHRECYMPTLHTDVGHHINRLRIKDFTSNELKVKIPPTSSRPQDVMFCIYAV
jgi:hypothetical protein